MRKSVKKHPTHISSIEQKNREFNIKYQEYFFYILFQIDLLIFSLNDFVISRAVI